MILPMTLNGYPVIAALPRDPLLGSYVVLVHRADHDFKPYVTGVWFRRKVEPADVASVRAAIEASSDGWEWGNYCATLEEGMISLVQRVTVNAGWSAELIKPELPHDKGNAPPAGFTRYRVELDVPDDEDPSALLERAQQLAADILDEHDLEYEDEDSDGASVIDRTSVQRMEG